MGITFYCGSGSPYAWRVWLTLEHKKLAYDLKVLSFQSGDLRKPDYLAVNPRGKVPSLIDGSVRLYESSAIVLYLEDAYPEPTLLPGDIASRALARRIAAEADAYIYPAIAKLMTHTLFRPHGDGDSKEIAAGQKEVADELARFETYAEREYFAGNSVSLADFAVYPFWALLKRINERQPANGVSITPHIAAWMKRIEALPYFERTVPPHWKTS